MSRVFVISEVGSSHDCNLDNAYKLIDAAKSCGADAVKFQMCSDPLAMAKRRGNLAAEPMYEKYLYPVVEWLPWLVKHARDVGIEFMCTAYLPQDIGRVAPFVKRYKVSAFESQWKEFIEAHPNDKPIIISSNWKVHKILWLGMPYINLFCVSEYPTPLEHLNFGTVFPESFRGSSYDGFSDHTGNVLTGAVVTGMGARIIEAHFKLDETSATNPDAPHSHDTDSFRRYVENIRLVERMI